MAMSDWIYRLKYKDADGTLTEREIEIKALRRGDKPSNTYIHAFCHLANDVRTFRLDRVRALYLGNQKIDDPMEYLTDRFEAGEIPADTEALAAEAAADAPEPASRSAGTKPPLPEITDIPKAKKGIRNSYIITAALIIFGFVSLPTVILPILFFGGALFFISSIRTVKKQIKKAESEVK
jgi:hypothetical protein